jgi:hypothetical protein
MRFKYLRDPLFVFSLLLYVLNRLLLRPLFSSLFLDGYLNDLLCIPFWVPIMLFVMRRCGLRRDDGPPVACEILIPVVLWSIIFELWLPFTSAFRGLAFADPVDIFCYTVGAMIAAALWTSYYGRDEGAATGPAGRQ